MARTDWYLEGVEFSNCNCNYGCPCQFEDLPTHGNCKGFGVVRVDKGYFGDVRLDGLNMAMTFDWPGPIFKGNGTMQIIVDERADARQRDALERISKGEETDEAATHWWVFHAMCSTVHPTISKPIQFDIDIDARTAQVLIPDVLESSGRPIISPATGQPHRVRIDIPDGIEFLMAEIGSASTKARGAVPLELNDSYGQFSRIRQNGHGVVR